MQVVSELKNGNLLGEYHIPKDGVIFSRQPRKAVAATSSFTKIMNDAFLPRGYPASVSKDYMAYQVWEAIECFCSTLTNMLATRAVLQGVGVGDETATASSAVITWLLRDGFGMAGRIVFAWYKGTEFDHNVKTWRIFADVLCDVAIFIELLAPMFPSVFVGLVCVSSILKSMVGVAGGATRVAVNLHQAKQNNAADVSAKGGSQVTLFTLVALLLSIGIMKAVDAYEFLTWILFVVFTFLHIFANVKAMQSLVFDTLNDNRADIVTRKFLLSGKVPSPDDVAVQEPVLHLMSPTPWLSIGESYSVLSSVRDKLHAEIGCRNLYLMKVTVSSSPTCRVVLHEAAASIDIIHAYLHAHRLRQELLEQLKTQDVAAVREAVGVTRNRIARDMNERFSDFVDKLTLQGWKLDPLQLEVGCFRSIWQLPSRPSNDANNVSFVDATVEAS